MAIKAGQILHAMNTFIVDRIQSGGAGNLNIPQERVYELGNFQSVGIVRDVPDLTFALDVLDVGTQVEALLCNPGTDPGNATDNPLGNGSSTAAGAYSLAAASTVDIISPFKSAQGAYDIVRGVAVPQLTLEQVQYRYGMKQNAGENFSLRGDSIYYTPGVPFQVNYTGDGTTVAYSFSAVVVGSGTAAPLTALTYTELGTTYHALNVSVDGVRQYLGTDYTEDAHGVTFNTSPAIGAKIRLVFGALKKADGTTSIEVDYTQTVNADLSLKPAAIRGRDIKVYVGGHAVGNLWHDVQSVEVNWRVNLDIDWEFGSSHAVARDYIDAPDVTGTVEIKSQTVAKLFDKLYQITGVNTADVVGPNSSITLPVVIQLLNPDSGGTSAVPRGTVLKTLYIPDARFTIPGYEGRVSQKLTSQLQFTSDKGLLTVFKGAPTNAQYT